MTKLAIELQKAEIVRLLRSGASDLDVRTQLEMRPKTYERRIKEMREESLNEVIAEETAEAKALFLKESISKIRAIELEANRILQETNDNTEKMAAMDRIRTYAIDIAKLKSEGPFMFNVIQRDGLHGGLQRSALDLRGTSLLSGSTTTDPTNEPTKDPNRVA